MDPSPVVDLSDAELRRRGGLKWTLPPADVLPAWVAEADVAPAPEITEAVRRAVEVGDFGYPVPDDASGLPQALNGYAARQWAWGVEPERVVVTADVMSGVLLALVALCDDAPVVVPTPAYPPFLGVVPQSGRELVPVPLDPDTQRAALDLEAVDAALARGARTVLLCNPHNPWGRAFTREELTALLAVVAARGARIVSDEIHAGLVLRAPRTSPAVAARGGRRRHDRGVGEQGLERTGAEVRPDRVRHRGRRPRRCAHCPLVYNHGTSPLGVHAAVAAYSDGQPWLDALGATPGDNRDLFAELVSPSCPGPAARALEATYLAWLDLRA